MSGHGQIAKTIDITSRDKLRDNQDGTLRGNKSNLNHHEDNMPVKN